MEEREIPKAGDRLAVLEKIADYERRGLFDLDVEEDPPGRVLRPEDIKYLDRGFSASIKRAVSFGAARIFFRRLLKNSKLV